MTSPLLHDQAIHRKVLALVDRAGHSGMTIAELRAAVPQNHHGTLSGVLSILHRDLVLARLSEKRDGCKVYVHPDFLAGREAEAQGRGVSKEEIEFGQSLVTFLEYWLQVDTAGSKFGTDRTKAERNQGLFFRELKGLFRERP